MRGKQKKLENVGLLVRNVGGVKLLLLEGGERSERHREAIGEAAKF